MQAISQPGLTWEDNMSLVVKPNAYHLSRVSGRPATSVAGAVSRGQ